MSETPESGKDNSAHPPAMVGHVAPQSARRAESDRASAVEHALQTDDVASAIQQSGLSADAVRRAVLSELQEQLGPIGVDEERLASLDSEDPVRRRWLMRRITQALILELTIVSRLIPISLVAIVGVFIFANSQTILGVKGTPTQVALAVGVALASLSALRIVRQALDQVVLRERSARSVVAARQSDAREKLDEAALRQARRAVNELVQTTFSHRLRPLDVEGLRDLSDTSYDVSTAAAEALKGHLRQLRAGNLGITGSRGSGKSTLLRQAVDGRLAWADDRPLGVEVPAPSRYDGREFIPHLLPSFALR